MRLRSAALPALALALGIAALAQETTNTTPPPQANPNPPAQGPAAHPGMGRGGNRGWAGFMAGRGVVGTVTEVGSDHYTLKTEMGDTYTVHFSANTRVIKQPPQRMNQGAGMGNGMRTPPQEIKATDIRVGDAIAATGEVDADTKSVGAMTVIKIDPEHAREMREMAANFGKTWLMGKVTEVKDTQVTVQSQVDNASHTFVADENTTFRRRREPVTLADLQVGESVRVEGAVKEGVFVASAVAVMGPPVTGGPAERPGPPPQ
jgi:preprotein translocase subunit YajC